MTRPSRRRVLRARTKHNKRKLERLFFGFKRISENRKTGPIPVTTSGRFSCPPACGLFEKGCYAGGGPLAIYWRNLKTPWKDLLSNIKALPKGQLWRHNQAGDLYGAGDRLNIGKLKELVSANQGKSGFTYTHKPLFRLAEKLAVLRANLDGFTINLSADTLAEADRKANWKIGPVTVLLPSDAEDTTWTPEGRKVIACPFPKVQCATCKLCARSERTVIIGFKAHGFQARAASEIAKG